MQADQDKLLGIQLAYKAQLADPDLVYKSIGFVNFVSTWVIRFVDPKRMHPHPDVEYVHPEVGKSTVAVLTNGIVLDCLYLKMFLSNSECSPSSF